MKKLTKKQRRWLKNQKKEAQIRRRALIEKDEYEFYKGNKRERNCPHHDFGFFGLGARCKNCGALADMG